MYVDSRRIPKTAVQKASGRGTSDLYLRWFRRGPGTRVPARRHPSSRVILICKPPSSYPSVNVHANVRTSRSFVEPRVKRTVLIW